MDWNPIYQEALSHLQNLIRINTTNPPGNELEAIRYLADVLRREGVEPMILEPTKGRANLVARISGSNQKRPLLLTSHVDVVPAEPKSWEVEPFSGTIKDGCLWGRGTIDMKQMTIMELMMVLLAVRQKIPLQRDLILVAVCDEEAGCTLGSKWLVEHHADLIRDAEYALNEVGAFSLYVGDHVFYPIGVAEKGVCWFKIRAHGRPGHGSIPHDQMATVRLGEAVARLYHPSVPSHVHPTVKGFFAGLAAHQGLIKRVVLKGLTVPGLNRYLLKLIPEAETRNSFYAFLHNTVSPTILRAGSKVNVIPSKAEVEVDGRIIPGQTVESFLDEIRAVIGRGYEIEVMQEHAPSAETGHDPFFDLLKAKLKAHDDRAVVIPYLIPGFTDSAYYRSLGVKCYGFAPVQLKPDMVFARLFHGHNERIPVDGFRFGLQVMWDVVREACT